MKTAKYWVKPTQSLPEVTCRGWSNISLADALQVAKARTKRVMDLLQSGQIGNVDYGYGHSPLPEPVLAELGASGGVAHAGAFAHAIVTRNGYGAKILNTADLVFVDIDLPAAPKLPGFISRLLGKKGVPAVGRPELREQIEKTLNFERIKARVYETAGGFRLLLLDRSCDPTSSEAQKLLERFGSDPLYRALCKHQECFRARLTPKPFRCGVANPPVTYPFAGSDEEAAFQEWLSRYEIAAAKYATCHLDPKLSSNRIDERFQDIVDLHDRETKALSDLPLA